MPHPLPPCSDDPQTQWVPDLTTPPGRRALARRVARSPAVVLDGPPAHLADLRASRPHLVIDVRAIGAGAVVALDYVLRPDPAGTRVLRRRLAILGFHDAEDPALEDAVVAWAILAREHAAIEEQRRIAVTRTRRLAQVLSEDD